MSIHRVCLALFVCCLAATAAAQQPTKNPKDVARESFNKGIQHYNLSEFAEALANFKEGYRAYPDSIFLFNIGQCQRQLGDKATAVLSYRAYIRERPDAPNRGEVGALIAGLERALQEEQSSKQRPPSGVMAPAGDSRRAESHAVEPSAPPPPPPATTSGPAPASTPSSAPIAGRTPPATAVELTARPAARSESRKPIYKKWWFWTVAGVVVAGGVGLGLGLTLAPAHTTYPHATTSDGTVNF